MAPSILTSNGTTRVMNGAAQSEDADMSGYQAFDHILWFVGNAKQAASYYVTRMGFKHVAYVCSFHYVC
jgi:4-hydroxyphenylpyruvate dioxygenase